MKFFNIDCHISVISDIKNIIESIDCRNTVTHFSLSDHYWVFNFKKLESPVLNKWNWMSINQEMCDLFYKTHKKELDKYDCFICAYPPAFLKLYEKFNKPIIVVVATRYDFPFLHDNKRLKWLEDSLKSNKNIIFLTNNEFDKRYCFENIGISPKKISSLCNYISGVKREIKNESILFSKVSISHSSQIVNRYSLGRMSFEELASYRKYIHMPYNCSTMSIFEQEAFGAELLFPSLEFSLELIWEKGINLFSEIVFPNSNPIKQPGLFLNREWLSLSDFYNGTIKARFFSSFNEMEEMVRDNEQISTDRFKERKESVFYEWKNILSMIS